MCENSKKYFGELWKDGSLQKVYDTKEKQVLFEISILYNQINIHEIIEKIPCLKFPSDYEVKIIPPMAGAIIRFHIKKGKALVSVYLDFYDMLGYYGSPYWEIYPYKDGDTYRCGLNDTDELLEAIEESLEKQNDKQNES